MPQFFISYSRSDEEFARKLATDLDRMGATLWIDTDDIPPGVNWSAAIQEGLDTCEALILVMSPESLTSSNVTDEWQYFRDERKPIIPVMWRPVPKMHFQLRRIQYVDFVEQDYETALEQLRARLFDAPPAPPVLPHKPAAPSHPITAANTRQIALKTTLKEHRDSVKGVSFSPDGIQLASCGEDKSVRLWQTAGRARMKSLIGHEKPVNAVAFSSSGTFLASASEDRTVRLWHVSKHFCITALRGHTAGVTAVTYSPSETLLASASEDGTVRLWDAKARKAIGVLGSHAGPVHDVIFNADGTLLLSGGEDQVVKWWDVAQRAEQRTFSAPDSVHRLALSPDSRLLALALSSSGLILIETAAQNQIASVRYADYNANCVRGLTFSPDGTLLIAASLDGAIRVWRVDLLGDGRQNRALRSLSGHDGGITNIALSADGTLLASASHDATVRLWSIKS